MKKFLWISGLILALAGIGVTLFLTYGHFNGTIGRLCGEGSACQTVLTSEYATVAGLPTALYGFVFYLTFFVGLLCYPVTHDRGQSFVLNGLLGLSTGAFLVSLSLIGLSFSVFNDLCFYCGISFTLVTLLFMGTVFWWIRGGREGEFETSSTTTWQGIAAGMLVLSLITIGLSIQWSGSGETGESEQLRKIQREASILAYDERSVGSPTAPIRVVEFYDLECPACQHFTNNVFPKIKRQYIDQGQVLWTFRSFPLAQHHPHAIEAHTALSMIPPSNYLEAKKTIMSDANQWVSKRVPNPRPYLDNLLSKYGLKNVEFQSDMRKHLLDQRNVYSRFGVNQTPSFLVNGELIKGGKPMSFWRQKFNQLTSEQTQ